MIFFSCSVQMCVYTSISLPPSHLLTCCHKSKRAAVCVSFRKSKLRDCNSSQGENKNISECLQGADRHYLLLLIYLKWLIWNHNPQNSTQDMNNISAPGFPNDYAFHSTINKGIVFTKNRNKTNNYLRHSVPTCLKQIRALKYKIL